MEVKFKLEVELFADINDGPLGEIEKTYGGMVQINSFVQEFLKHPEAVLSYYRSYFLDKFIENSTEEWEMLGKQLNYIPDFSFLFKEIAKNCPGEVTEFINDIYSEDTVDKRDKFRKEIERRMLEDQLRPLKVHLARFSKL